MSAGKPFVPVILFGLDGKAKRNFARAIEKLNDMVANEAAKLAPLARPGCQFNPAISGTALRTGGVGLPHDGKNTTTTPVVYTVDSLCWIAFGKSG
jgi:hypothetical protein